ncbi:beta-Ala-His dipeptidase [Candidatus Roizmanbacteria bacterium]|nr:beta-Ala-His dipeptidase [Candidatus Roizmanbacteria bacterium]
MAVIDARSRQIEFLKEIHRRPGITPRLWETFAEITTIPRPSHSEGPMVDYLELLAVNSDLKYERDPHNNIFIHVPATTGYENAPKIILQCHSDMVPQQDKGAEYNPTIDGVHAIVHDDGSITADKTTLGADNGIGVAMALTAVADLEIRHGEIGLLVTSSEEDGLGGAEKLNFESMRKFDYMLNLDSEVEGEATIGSAGGGYTHITMPLEKISSGDRKLYTLDISGLAGGHSGLKINQGGGNSIKVLAQILSEASKDSDINLVSIGGGDVLNAIPKESKAIIAVREDQVAKLNTLIEQFKEQIRSELRLDEEKESFNAKFEPSETITGLMLSSDSSSKVLQLISDLPHGVKEMTGNSVLTSTNLARIETNETSLRISMMSRSAIVENLSDQRRDIKVAANDKSYPGIMIEQLEPFPGWEPKENTKLVEVAKRVYNELTGDDLKTVITHGGLECGLIGNKYPNLSESIISIGSTIENAHETTEKTYFDTNERTYRFVKALITGLSS